MIVWLEQQTLCALTGWSWEAVKAMSRRERQASLVFRDEWVKVNKGK